MTGTSWEPAGRTAVPTHELLRGSQRQQSAVQPAGCARRGGAGERVPGPRLKLSRASVVSTTSTVSMKTSLCPISSWRTGQRSATLVGHVARRLVRLSMRQAQPC